MSGNQRSGRTPKPVGLHVLQGTYRAPRHGAAVDNASGQPIKPEGLSEAAGRLWDLLAAELGGIPKRIDGPALQALAEVWSLYRAALKSAEADPLSKPARSAVLGYLAAFDRLAARFGLTPADRQRLRFPAAPSEPDEFERYLARGKLAKYTQ